MRRSLILAGLAAGLAVPSTAAAQAEPVCPLVSGPYDYQAALSPYADTYWTGDGVHNANGGVQGAARRALGAQFTGFWFDTFRQGLSVAFAPGPLDATAARASIVEALAADFTPEQIAFVTPSLHLLQDTYGEAELNAAWEQIKPIVTGSGFDMTSSFGCFDAGAWRITVTRGLVPEVTPEIKAETEALFAQFGDKVVIRYVPHTTVVTATAGPAPAQAPPSPPITTRTFVDRPAARVLDYVRLPAYNRCVPGGTLAVNAGKKAGLRSVTLSAGKRHATAHAGKQARLKLKQRSTRVTVTVKLDDGRSATKRVTYKRCA